MSENNLVGHDNVGKHEEGKRGKKKAKLSVKWINDLI